MKEGNVHGGEVLHVLQMQEDKVRDVLQLQEDKVRGCLTNAGR